MSRVQLALNVDDVEEAVAFYSRLFRAEPANGTTCCYPLPRTSGGR